MRRLKRDEARALMLKAEGLSYVEIGERLGWTYTKVNRCITEGRRRFMKLYAELETGVECERLAPTLVALASGTASSEALLELRPHLRNCAACRATVRQLHASRLRRLTAFLPFGVLVAPARAIVERFRAGGGGQPRAEQAVDLGPMEQSEHVDEVFRRLNAGEAAVQPVAPSVAETASRLSSARVNLREWAEAALQRLQSSDLAMSVHAATSGGGGRVASVAALLGICVSGVGAGTYCVATALLPDPKPAIRAEAKPAKAEEASKPRTARSRPARTEVSPKPTDSARTQQHTRSSADPRRTTVSRSSRLISSSSPRFSFERLGCSRQRRQARQRARREPCRIPASKAAHRPRNSSHERAASSPTEPEESSRYDWRQLENLRSRLDWRPPWRACASFHARPGRAGDATRGSRVPGPEWRAGPSVWLGSASTRKRSSSIGCPGGTMTVRAASRVP